MIQFTSYYPNKNQVDVGINENITAKIQADFKLDPRNVKFSIYGVEIVPEVYTVYYGSSHYELDIVLYSKKRVKYNTEKRYGQEDFRYGMTDVYPSMLNYDSRYSVEITVFGTNDAGEREEAFERFAFTTEKGVFENSNPPDYFYSPFTQALANYFPEWSKTRYDKHSTVQQILNPFGNKVEELQDFTTHHNKNFFIQTTNLNELSSLYKVELGKDYKIDEILAKSGDSYYVQPEITGVSGITKIDLFTRDKNSLEDLGKVLPTRLDIEREEIPRDILHQDIEISAHKNVLKCQLDKPRYLYFYVEDSPSSIYKKQERTYILQIRITGTDQYNEEKTEDLLLLQERPLVTRYKWREIESLELLNADTQKARITICTLPRPRRIVQDFRQTVGIDDLQNQVYWGTRDSGLGTVLEERVESGDDIFSFLQTSGRTSVVQEFHLTDVDNVTPVNLIDFTVDPFTNWIYGIDENFLYIYDKRERYASHLKEIPGDNGESDMVILVEDDKLGFDDSEKEILFKIVHRTPGTSIIKYRIKVTAPDKTFFYINYNSQKTLNKNEAIVFPDQNSIMIPERQYSFTADQRGLYQIDLEVLPKGSNFTNHIQHISIGTKSALIKYKLERILSDSEPISIGFYEDHSIKIFDSKNVLNSLIFRKDGVVIDYTEKILYFIEDYELIEVE